MQHEVCVGVIGTGFGASVHIPAFQSIPGCTVMGVTGRSVEKVRACAQKYSCKAYESWTDMLADPTLDAISIALPPVIQPIVAELALKKGRHLFCEKPLAQTAADALALLRLAQATKKVHAVDFEFRELSALQEAKRLLAIEGDIQRMRVRWRAGTWSDATRPPNWKVDKNAGGGVMHSLGVHILDYVRWLSGRNIVGARGTLVNTIGDRATAETRCEATLMLEENIPVDIEVDNATMQDRGHRIDLYTAHHHYVIDSVNSEDYARGFELRDAVSGKILQQQSSSSSGFTDGRIALVRAVADRFVRAIQSGENTGLPTFADGVHAQRVLEAIRQSSEEDRFVDITREET